MIPWKRPRLFKLQSFYFLILSRDLLPNSTEYMQFDERWRHITHVQWLCRQPSGICSSHLGMLREKSYYKGPVFLWTSVVQLSPLLSILMPTSNCENLSCFRRKSIPCVDPLPFTCIMFFAMKGSYEPENVFGGCFFFFFYYCKLPLSSVFKEVQDGSDGHLLDIQWKYTRYSLLLLWLLWVYVHLTCLTMTIPRLKIPLIGLWRWQFKQNALCVMQISISSDSISPN